VFINLFPSPSITPGPFIKPNKQMLEASSKKKRKKKKKKKIPYKKGPTFKIKLNKMPHKSHIA
jgi:hypothetical protein